MRLIISSLLSTHCVLSYQIINDARANLQFLRVRRKNSGFFEETRSGDYKRECLEEMCSAEELDEIYDHDKSKTIDTADGSLTYDAAWQRLTKRCYVDVCNAQGTKVCIQKWNQRTCVCKPGYDGGNCGDDIDECSFSGESKVCTGAHMKCDNTHGSYSCGCENNYKQEGDECIWDSTTCADNPCGLNQECTDSKDAGYTCDCLFGFVDADGSGNCVDIDECADENICSIREHSTCFNEVGGYSCMCDEGYEEVDGLCVEIPKCRGVVCDVNGYCDDLDGTCYCNVGFKGDSVCVDIDECTEGVFGITGEPVCQENQLCENTVGSFTCSDIPEEPTTAESTTEEAVEVTTVEEVTTETAAPPKQEHGVTLSEITTEAIKATEAAEPAPSNNGRCSVDVDECQVNNGDCPGMCMNYFCHRKCYEEISEEAKMCHHYSTQEVPTESNDMKDYACHCFAGYKLCVDQFSCIPETSDIEYDTHSNCAAGQIGIDASCYSISTEKASFDAASDSCNSQGGSLADIQSRKAWFILGSSINNGQSSFWVGNSSDADMNIFGNGSGRLANPAQDMSNVPPQMDNVDGSEEHIYVCQF